MRRILSLLLPVAGAVGFVLTSDLSLRGADTFVLWSLATIGWILLVFAAIAGRQLRGRLSWVSIPAVVMIAISTAVSLLFLDLVTPRRGFIAFFALILYLFLEHVRREAASDTAEERLTIGEFARMVNIGSLFLLVSAGIGTTIFLPISPWWTVPPVAAVAALWSWHLYLACTTKCGRPGLRILLTTGAVVQTYLVALQLPTPMFVGGALVGVVYYLAANLLPAGEGDAIPMRLVRKYVLYAGALLALVLMTARWL